VIIQREIFPTFYTKNLHNVAQIPGPCFESGCYAPKQRLLGNAKKQRKKMKIVEGVTLLDGEVHTDVRGRLTVFERAQRLPFVCQRLFFMESTGEDVVRGGHANSCDEVIFVASGSALIDVDNGHEQATVRLFRRDQMLHIRSGILIVLREFAPGTILVVCASHTYGDTENYAQPQPHLFRTERS
jgi:hypothetical protein